MISKEQYINIHSHEENTANDRVSVVNVYPDNLPEFKKVGLYSIGIHPWYIPDKNVGKLLTIVGDMAKREEVVAIGECGLDKLSAVSFDVQQFVFEKHIEIAEKVQKPLIIHCVRSFNELVQIKMHSRATVEWIVHGFNSKLDVADLLLRHEMYLSFGKALLNPESNASKVLPQIEDEMYLLETDDSSVGIDEIYSAAAERVNMDMDILKLSMQTNFINCFKL
ncbi:MAG: TatD family hydrolase [Bacteroidales bacterium]